MNKLLPTLYVPRTTCTSSSLRIGMCFTCNVIRHHPISPATLNTKIQDDANPGNVHNVRTAGRPRTDKQFPDGTLALAGQEGSIANGNDITAAGSCCGTCARQFQRGDHCGAIRVVLWCAAWMFEMAHIVLFALLLRQRR